VRIHGKEHRVAAQIRRLGNYSAHADQGELLEWILERRPFGGGLFLNHGDDDARVTLRELLGQKGLEIAKIFMPAFDESYQLVPGEAAVSAGRPEPRIEESQIQRDWYNDYADFMLQLDARLELTADDKARKALIEKLLSAINE
jgi:metallo-beta-lactamase family protein